MTVDDFADLTKLERNVAYGFLRFLAETGLVKTGTRKQPEGKRGKPTTLYYLDADMATRLMAYLGKNLPVVTLAENSVAVDVPVSGQDSDIPVAA